MRVGFFKIRDKFSFCPHQFEIGNPIFQGPYIENYFFKKLFTLQVSDISSFYNFHLEHYMQRSGSEAEFFAHVWEITEDRIRYYKRQDPFSARHTRNREYLEKLKAFQSFLDSINQWKKGYPFEYILEEKESQIASLKEEVAQLQAQVQKQRPYEPSEKIAISDKNLATFIDLIKQMQSLVLPDGRKLLRFQSQSSWYKMICKYFEHGSTPIPLETARNYFPAKKDTPIIKGSQIADHLKIFKIVPVDPEKIDC